MLMDTRKTQVLEDDDWHERSKMDHRVERHLLGHHLLVEPLCKAIVEEHHLNNQTWFKWIDGHYRGTATNLVNAEHELEREAQALDTAWKKKLAWNGVERRRGNRQS